MAEILLQSRISQRNQHISANSRRRQRGVSLPWQEDNFAISAEDSLDLILKLHFPNHLHYSEEGVQMEEVGELCNSTGVEEVL